jgi:hypothetical protein
MAREDTHEGMMPSAHLEASQMKKFLARFQRAAPLRACEYSNLYSVYKSMGSTQPLSPL